MSAEDTKPVDTAPPAAEPAATEPVAETTPAAEPAVPAAEPSTTAAETKVEEAPAAVDEAPKVEETPAAAAEDKKEEKAEEKKTPKKPVEPITAGHLRYKAPASFPKNLINQAHELYFWLGDEAAVEAKHFSHFLSSAKTDYARNAVAWSTQTGKGLLYYAKHKDHKDTPSGVLPLAEASNITTKGTTEFVVEVGGHRHVFITSGEHEREGWLKAIRPEAETASAKKDEIHGSEGFKKALEEAKPAAVAGASAERTTREDSSNGKDKDKAKSRSLSRGKRGSLFDRLSGKKDEAKEEPAKTEEPAKKEETVADAAAAPVVVEPTPAAETTEPAPAAEAAPVVAATEEAKKDEPKPAESPKKEEVPKAERRSSRFGDFFKKISSPTHEKSQADATPATPVIKEPEAEAPAAAAAEPVAETPEPAKAAEIPSTTATVEATTPTKEKKKFFDVGKIFPKEKAKSPTTETPPKISTEVPAASTTSAEPAAAATEAEGSKAAETPVTNGESKATPDPKDNKRRSSFFTGDLAGSIKKLGGKSEKKVEPAKTEPAADAAPANADETKPAEAEAEASKAVEPKKEHKENPLSQLGRRVSTALRGKKEAKKEAATPPANVEETAEPAEAAKTAEAPKIEEPVTEAEKPAEEAKPAEAPAAPQAIGDVVPEAVNIGSAPPASNTVQATA